LSLNRGLRLIRDSSARMSSYWRSRYPTISPKLTKGSVLLSSDDLGQPVGPHALLRCQSGHRIPGYQQWLGRFGCPRHPIRVLGLPISTTVTKYLWTHNSLPTVTGLMRTPSSIWALAASSASFDSRTCCPQSVLTKVVRPKTK